MFKSKTNQIIIFFCIVKLALHLIADFNSGFQGDELLHIETGNHLAWGYMEFPPLIGWLAYIQNSFQSQSVFVHHIFVHIASLLMLVIIARTTIELGGKDSAVFIVLLCMLAAPAFGRSQQLFQPVVLSQLFWTLSFYQLVRFIKVPQSKYLFYLTICISFGWLAKYDMLFFIAGLSSLLFYKKTRAIIWNISTLKYVFIFLLLIIPNLIWQYQHQFPVLQMFTRLYETQLDKLDAFAVLKGMFISLNPFTTIFWVGGLLFMFNKNNKAIYRPVAVSIIISIIFLAASKSKAYYFYPVIISLFIFGAIWFEQKVLNYRKWIFYLTTVLLLVSGLILAPFSLALMPVDSFIKFAHLKKEDGHYPMEFQEYYAQSKWKKTLTAIKNVYDSLPPTEQKDCLIWGKHYSQAGAVNLYRRQYNLPKAFSYHGSFYLWAPEGNMPETIIAFTNEEASIDFFRNYFSSVIPVKQVYNPYASFNKDNWQTIYVCKNPKQSFDDMKELFSKRIFE